MVDSVPSLVFLEEGIFFFNVFKIWQEFVEKIFLYFVNLDYVFYVLGVLGNEDVGFFQGERIGDSVWVVSDYEVGFFFGVVFRDALDSDVLENFLFKLSRDLVVTEDDFQIFVFGIFH